MASQKLVLALRLDSHVVPYLQEVGLKFALQKFNLDLRLNSDVVPQVVFNGRFSKVCFNSTIRQ